MIIALVSMLLAPVPLGLARAFVRTCSSMKRRMAQDRLPRWRVLSISVTIFDAGTPSVRAIFFRLLQKCIFKAEASLCVHQ